MTLVHCQGKPFNITVAQVCLNFVTPWTAALQASLPFTISQSLLKITSIVSVMPSSHLILCGQITIIQVYVPTTNDGKAKVEQFY